MLSVFLADKLIISFLMIKCNDQEYALEDINVFCLFVRSLKIRYFFIMGLNNIFYY